MSENLMVKLYEGLSPQERSGVFDAIMHLKGVAFVTDLGAIGRDTLDSMLMPKQEVRDPAESRNRGSKIIYAKSERQRREPIPIERPKSLRERLSR